MTRGDYDMHEHGSKFGADAIGQMVLIEWHHADPFQPVELESAESITFNLLHEMLTASGDRRYRGFLVLSCNKKDPAKSGALVYVQRLGSGRPPAGPMASAEFATALESSWLTEVQS